MGDIFIPAQAAVAAVAVFVVDGPTPAGTAITASNTTGDNPIPYAAGKLGSDVLVFINGLVKRAGAGSDITEVTPASGSFAYAYDLHAGDTIQMIPRGGA